MRPQETPITIGIHAVPVPTPEQALAADERVYLDAAITFAREQTGMPLRCVDVELHFVRLTQRMQCLTLMETARQHPHFNRMPKRDAYLFAFQMELESYSRAAKTVLAVAHRLSQIKLGVLSPSDPKAECQYFVQKCNLLADIAEGPEALEEWDFKYRFYQTLLGREHRFFGRAQDRQAAREKGLFLDEIQTNESAKKDTLLPIFCEDILYNLHTVKTLIDYGCGQGTLLIGFAHVRKNFLHKLKRLKYIGFDILDTYTKYIRTEMHAQFSDTFNGIEAFTLETPAANERIESLALKGSILVIRNILHEVPLLQQATLWRNAIRLACPNGSIFIFEIMDLPNEEANYVLWDQQDIATLASKLSIPVEFNHGEPFDDSFPVLRAKLLPSSLHQDITTKKVLDVLCVVYQEKIHRFAKELADINKRRDAFNEHHKDWCRRVSLDMSIRCATEQLANLF